ncbi:MAG: carboxylesterase [Betaproteobacteria bacterium]|nr:MAG: carboxylesterase [Betaproteobacteria bacterium]
MPAEVLPSIELETAPNPTASVIWLHGLGADGNDFVPIVPELRLPESLRVRFVFPHAPVRAVTINNGMRMRAWYDIAAADLTNRADLAGVRESQGQLGALIERENARGMPSERIVLAEASGANRKVPIFMAHGTADPVVRFQWGESSKRLLETAGYAVEWRSYRMEHSVCVEEVQAIGAWLTKVL